MKMKFISRFHLITAILSLLILSVLGPSQSFAFTEIEGETSGSSVRVTSENRRSVITGPPVQQAAPRDVSNSAQRQNVRGNSGSRYQGGANSQDGGSTEELRCRNRSEIYSAMTQGRECDPSIPPFAMTVPNEPDAEPVANQPEIVEEPVEIIITASDLLELIPSSPQIMMDRGPFGLKNAHTNFYASDSGPQTVTQTMFGQQVTITATPVEYRWDYGDGNTLVTELPGHPVDVFNTETDTSHQYTDTGLYSVGLTTEFEGTYQVDGGEIQMVSSTVTQQADPVEIRIWRAVTRNVDQTCQQDPQAWGC